MNIEVNISIAWDFGFVSESPSEILAASNIIWRIAEIHPALHLPIFIGCSGEGACHPLIPFLREIKWIEPDPDDIIHLLSLK